MRIYHARTIWVASLCCLALWAQDYTALRTQVLREAEDFKEQLPPDPLRNHPVGVRLSPNEQAALNINLSTDTLLTGVREAQSQPQELPLRTYRTITTASNSIGSVIERSQMPGKDTWLTLCYDIVRMLATSSFGKQGMGLGFYCPNAQELVSSIRKTAPPQTTPPPTRQKEQGIPGPIVADGHLVSFLGFSGSAILGSVYAGRFEAVADDAATRNYLFSVAWELREKCVEYRDDPFPLLNYALHDEMAALRRGTTEALNNEQGAALQDLLRAGAFGGRGEARAEVVAHLTTPGTQDGAQFVSTYKCGGPPTSYLYSNILKIAGYRNQITPDTDPNAGVLPLALKKACDSYVSGARSSTKAEGFCRCQVQAMISSGIPANELNEVAKGITANVLRNLIDQHADYKRKADKCYD
jgi:hypothetical protein